ncbi:photosynthetic complex putative assembly protein PuhB [Sphingomonas sp.]
MIAEHEIEPIRGLPGELPAGERILWQGRPEWRALARTALHTRAVAVYFAVLTLAAAIGTGSVFGTAMTLASGLAALGLLHLLAWAMARATVYTLTDKRLVLRLGVALPKCINIPLRLITSIDLVARQDGTGDVALAVPQARLLGYAALWPHVRPWKLARPQPMLRGIAHADKVGAMIARHCETTPESQRPTARAPVQAVAA